MSAVSDACPPDHAVAREALLSVDLIGPALLMKPLVPLVFGFPSVARVRLLPALPRRTDGSPSGDTRPRPRLLDVTVPPLPPLTPAVTPVALCWHECRWHPAVDEGASKDAHGNRPAFLPFPERSAVLCGGLGNAILLPIRGPVALSLFDPPEMLEAGLQAAARGERYVSPVIAPFLLSPFSGDACRADIARFRRQAMGTPALSVREREVAEWAAAGLSNEEIAERLFLSVTTVKSHLMRAFAKLGIQRRSQLRSALEAVPLAAMKRFPPSDESSADPYETVDIICHTKEGFFVTALF